MLKALSMHCTLLKYSTFDKITHGQILISLLLVLLYPGRTQMAGSEGPCDAGCARMNPSSLLHIRSLNKTLLLLQQNKRQKAGIYKGERKKKKKTNQPCSHHSGQNSAVANLLSPFSAASSYRNSALERGGKKKKNQTQHLKPKPRSRHKHLGCSSSADLLAHCSPGAAEAEVRKVPAGIGERLLPILRAAPGEAPGGTAGVGAALRAGLSLRSPPDSHTALPRCGSLLRLPLAAGTASSTPGWETPALLWATGSLAQRLGSRAKPSGQVSAHPAPTHCSRQEQLATALEQSTGLNPHYQQGSLPP